MKPPRGKRLALILAMITFMVVVGAGFALKDRIREEWWLYKLEHGDDAAQKSAAERLGEMQSLRAVPTLVEKMVELAPRNFRPELRGVGVGAGTILEPPDAHGQEEAELALNWPGQALASVGVPAMPSVLEALRKSCDGREGTPGWSRLALQYWCMETIARMGPSAVGALRALCEDPDDRAVTYWVTAALKRIEGAADGSPR